MSARFFFFFSRSLSGTNTPSSKKEIERVAFEILAPHYFFKAKKRNIYHAFFLVLQIFDAFLQRKSLQPGSVRFLFDGERVREDQTPQELDMEDGDSLDVMMEQVGGK